MNMKNEKNIDSVKKFYNINNTEEKAVNYIGIKDTNVISADFIRSLEKFDFRKHTLDKMAYKGRAIDIDLINPITGRCMTGSSSGTALNVFYGINDIGIGTDGGGSVLAPALSLNLYGFISPLIDKEYVKKFIKKSTDGIEFYPSIGFIAKEYKKLEYIINKVLNLEKITNLKQDIQILLTKPKISYHKKLYKNIFNIFTDIKEIELLYDSLNRREMILELSKINFDNNILISYEGPIDLFGYGDSVLGHYSKYTEELQKLGHKYYLKVINMMNLTAFIIPTPDLALGYLVICKSEENYIREAIKIVRKLKFERSNLETKYFE